MNRAIAQTLSVAVVTVFVVAANTGFSEMQSFSRMSAIVDMSIPESVRAAFDDDDGRPMRSVSVDLNNDKNPEKLIPNEFLCGNGGCPWLVYSPSLKRVIGRVFGRTITVLETASEGFKSIQITGSLGANKRTSTLYEFRDGGYRKKR